MIDPLTILYENLGDSSNPHIEAPFTIEDILKTNYTRVNYNYTVPLGRLCIMSYNHTDHLRIFKWDDMDYGSRDEIDKKTKLVLPSYMELSEDQKTVYTLSWRLHGARNREDKDPITKESLPAKICFTPDGSDSYISKFWFINDNLHRVDGPAVVWYDKAGEIINEEYYINDLELSKQKWEQDPEVKRILDFKKLEDKGTKDDDFLRTFGSVL